jgi:phosphoribosylformylglycinamidine cyclo-ligase
MSANSLPATYAQAGVDIEAGNEVVRRIAPHARRTHTPGVLGGLGGFGALFRHDFTGYTDPLLVSATDGVGTKLKVAFELGRHDTIGQDLVAMCVNDLICSGAQPLFFLDYFATGHLAPAVAESVVKGIADGCLLAGCALIGGETAELPGFYQSGEYDLAGFAVGVVDRPKLIDGTRAAPGDVLIGLASSGLHSNGYSLARRLLEPLGYLTYREELGTTVGEALLAPTKIYVEALRALGEAVDVKGLANITGGGFYENIPRALPQGVVAAVTLGSWPMPPLFTLLAEQGSVERDELFTTFNMGVGLVAVVPAAQAASAIAALAGAQVTATVIGTLEAGEGAARVELRSE